MKKIKNVVVFLLDSVTEEDNSKVFNKLFYKYKQNSIIFNNYYSQAPYTEAAIVSLLTSTRTLDYNGYLNNLKYKPYTVNEIFNDLGYKTFNSLWYYPNTESLKRGVDNFYYIHSISYFALYTYRVSYYIDLFKSGLIKDRDIELLINLFRDFFLTLKEYIEDYEKKPERFKLLKKYSNIDSHDFTEYENILTNEKELFEANEREYIINILKDNRKDLFKIKDIIINESEFYESKKIEIENLCRKKSFNQVINSIINNNSNKSIPVINKFIKQAIKERDYTYLKRALLYTLNYTIKPRYNMLSAKCNIENVKDYLIENKEDDNFIFCHLMDTHFPFNFISKELDSTFNDEDVNYLKLANNCESENVFYNLSIEYVYRNIDRFINNLKNEQMLSDTLIIITSDHGSSYTSRIFRNEKVCTFFEENYKIPLIFYNPNINGKVINNLMSSIDFIPTVLDFLNLNYDKYNLEGKSVIESKNEYIFYEYFGAGCPDIYRKNKLFAIKDDKYKIIATLINGKLRIDGIYDLENDPREINNIKNEKDENSYMISMIDELEKRVGMFNE